MDELCCHRFVGRAGKRLLDARLKHRAAVDDCSDVRDSPKRWILTQCRPVAVIGDDPRPVVRNALADQSFHGARKGLQYLSLLHCCDPFKCVDIVGVNGEEAHEFIHALIHMTIEFCEGSQILPDFHLLVSSLFE
jgi:hypothetical protein